jgi:hypothetical protein
VRIRQIFFAESSQKVRRVHFGRIYHLNSTSTRAGEEFFSLIAESNRRKYRQRESG